MILPGRVGSLSRLYLFRRSSQNVRVMGKECSLETWEAIADGQSTQRQPRHITTRRAVLTITPASFILSVWTVSSVKGESWGEAVESPLDSSVISTSALSATVGGGVGRASSGFRGRLGASGRVVWDEGRPGSAPEELGVSEERSWTSRHVSMCN